MARFRSLGYFEDIDPNKGVVLSGETFTCAHCNMLIELRHKECPAMCEHEWLPICMPCELKLHRTGTCTPFGTKLDKYEKRAAQTFAQRMEIAMRRREFLQSVGIE